MPIPRIYLPIVFTIGANHGSGVRFPIGRSQVKTPPIAAPPEG